MVKYFLAIASVLSCAASFAQAEFMVHGRLRSHYTATDTIYIKAESKSTRDFRRAEKLPPNSYYRIFFPYGDEYTLEFSQAGMVTYKFTVSTVFPHGIEQCCRPPLELSLRMLQPGWPQDSLFAGVFMHIGYSKPLSGFNYDIDVDFTAQQRISEAEINKQQAEVNKHRRKQLEDSLEKERAYLRLINQGNILYSKGLFAESASHFLKASQMEPRRSYPLYKLEDIKTAVELFNSKAGAMPIRLDSIKPLPEPPKPQPRPVFTYTPPSPEEIERRVWAEIRAGMEAQEKDPAAVEQRINALAAIVSPEQPAAARENTPANKDTSEIAAIGASKKIIPEQKLLAPEPAQKTAGPQDTLEFDYKAYQLSLLEKYPDTRTIEIEEDFAKKTTRVIINKDSRVYIYLKVEHAWGGVYYFVDRTPLHPENISKAFFDSETLQQGLKDTDQLPAD
jgi:hypothetical protein